MRAIDADAMIDRLERVIQNGVPSENGMHPISAETVLEVIKQLPPIQPEIVRCGECKYHYQRNCPIERYFSLNGFCSRGERKDGDVTCENCDYSEKYTDGLILCRRTKTSHRVSVTSTCGKGKREVEDAEAKI